MTKTLITGSTILGLAMAGGLTGMVSAQTVSATTGLSEEQIIEIALSEVPGTVTEIELDDEDGLQIYEVEILAADGTEYEVEINAESGEILEVEAEDEDDEDDDDDDHDDDHDGDDDA